MKESVNSLIMRRFTRFIKVIVFIAVCICIVYFKGRLISHIGKSDRTFADYVDPMIGTDFTGHTFPGATAPFGMVQLSPDTRVDTWEGCSGYHYSDDTILGFTHTHLSGTGCLDYGDVLLMPVTGYDGDSLDRRHYSSKFSHKREEASAGYYSVHLDRWEVDVELTVGERAAMHRYTFGRRDEPMVVIDLKHRDVLLESDLYRIGDRAIAGFRRSSAWSPDQMVCFYIEFSAPIAEYRPFGREGAVLRFGRDSGREIIAKVGISSVSADNAKQNLLSEVPEGDFGFDTLHARTVELWNGYLSKIDVLEGCDDEERLMTFYTALYHTAIAPNLYSDVNGEYRGMDRQIHRAEGFDRYTVFSLWDTFRTLHPLLALIDRERTEDFLQSFLTIYREGGKLPIWELSGHETNCMIGYNSVPVIADALAKGIGVNYAAELLEAMVESSRKDEFGIRWYRERYVVPAEKEHESVSKTLEYAYDDWCIAQVAGWLYEATKEDDANERSEYYAQIRDEYMKYSGSYANVLDPERHLVRGVMNGMWLSPFEPREVNNHFTEANSWQYSFFAPHDVNGLIAYHGGDEAFCAMLDSLFTAPSSTKGRTQVDITGLIGQYAHGNEPSHQTAYLYSYAGQPWKTTSRVRQILTELYHADPDGLCGNDDCGQMSAWYVMSAIGLYPVTPGSNVYVLSAPLFENVTVNLENGKHIYIKTHCAGKIENTPYISAMFVKGQHYSKTYINYDEIADGTELLFELSPEPSYEYGVKPEDRPVARGYEGFVRNPWFEAAGDTFEDTLTVAVNAGGADNAVFYSIDGGRYRQYRSPLLLDKTTTLSIYAQSPRGEKTPVITSTFYKEKNDMDITTLCRYNPQYNARGERGLIDGMRGSVNWKTGGWQGFQDTDFEAVVDLRGERTIRAVGSGYCQDARSWIWMPRYVEYSVSDDGVNFESVGRVENTVDPQDYEIQVQDFVLKLPQPLKTRYIKVFAKNFGTIPEWHLGAGGEGFIFIDEIYVK